MITAIVIPILFAYFYYLTKKERRKYYEKWTRIRNVKEEAWVKGIIIDVQERKERYYHHYFIHVIDVILHVSDKKIIARTQLPATTMVEKPIFLKRDTIICYGQWRNGIFFFEKFLTNHSTEV